MLKGEVNQMRKNPVISSVNTRPRARILDTPTPLIRLERLSDALDIDLWMKRDDLAGPSFGGNKARQLEYYFGAAQEEDADTILITGAVQSNFVRLAAATAARFGMKVVLQLEERVATSDQLYRQSGNVLLNRILGAEIMSYPEGEDEAGADAALYAKAEELRAAGRQPYVIPLGINSPPIGALGYVQGATEITEQSSQPFDKVVVASGSAATHLGLTAGMKIFSPATEVIGACVRRSQPQQQARLAHLGQAFNALVGCPDFLAEKDFHLWDGALAPGYGRFSPPAREAMILMARLEGHVLDPVYTAKSFAAVPALVRTGRISKGSRVVFVHTGGLGAFFAYQNELAALGIE